ncbi:thiamine diphosphokinase [Roseivivax isoporae]|uniref:Thiamine diphosphokinase n=1 Tax=Roseivivax isoporae LMG 25204 TaxID=1449351 RepID=X7FBA0_9RHOB|nr:thiamine diphosphokinase [Roseivivax isoporae]ETX30035.1 thiamine pyrophosphokinase [Roseivivax isoporae LMG 25204]
MKSLIVESAETVLLVGGGACEDATLSAALDRLSTAIAADGGADRLLALGRVPDALIGDLDSVSEAALARLPPDRVHRIDEQDTTDFDKCLRSVAAPLVEAHGFLGARLDHSLAVLNTLARHPHRPCLLVGPDDAVALVPPVLDLDLTPGTRVSLWPLAAATGRSRGLKWPIDGLTLAPDGITGTSNEALGPVTLAPDVPRLLLMLPVASAPALARALVAAPRWPAP